MIIATTLAKPQRRALAMVNETAKFSLGDPANTAPTCGGIFEGYNFPTPAAAMTSSRSIACSVAVPTGDRK